MSEHRVRQFSKCWLVTLLLFGARELAAGYICQPGTPGPPAINRTDPSSSSTTFSVSTTCSEQVMTTNLTQRVDQFSTELRARLQGGPLLLDQTFAASFTDPVVQSALVSARQLLAGQGALGFIGPTLLGNNISLTGAKTVPSVIQTAPSQDLVTIGTQIGPRAIQIGVIGQCQGADASGVPFGCAPNAGNQLTVVVGTTNFNANTHTFYSLGVTNTTTNTFLTSQVYELDGTSGPAAIPEPGTFCLMALAIAGLYFRIHRSGKHHV